MIGRQERLLSYRVKDRLSLVGYDVVVFLSDQSEARFSKTMRREANIARLFFATFAYRDHILPSSGFSYIFYIL